MPDMQALLAKARELYGVFGKSERALAVVERALAESPEDVEALNLQAAILYDLDRDEEARDAHLRALAREPCSVEALHGLAALANDRSQYTEALAWLERAFHALPQDPSVEFRDNADYRQRVIAQLYVEQAQALWNLAQRDEARRVLREDGPRACPLEVETLEDELEWLENNP